MKGKVWLIGAGPGDEGLMTVKGKRVLKSAEVVVYDALVGRGILSMLPESAEMIYVGKKSGNHSLAQEKINELLLQKALEGKRVVRLKGGDPFLFGRGGEELELLCEHGIEFEIVPGVTSSISVPAYAGIPVTHRDFASELHIITAHRKQGEEEKIDFKNLVALKNATLVFMMGVGRISDICKGLKNAGMDAKMPAAILEKGTTHAQRRVVGTISDLPEKAKESNIGFPGIILVGKVCALADKFHWAEDRALGKTRVIVTRPRNKASKLTDQLRELGAEVLCLPTIETKAINIDAHIKQMKKVSWILFTSITAVDVFFETLKSTRTDIRELGKVKFAAVGTGTAKVVENRGVMVEYIPEIFCGQELGEGLPFEKNETILLFKPKGILSECEAVLNNRGAKVITIEAYETVKTHAMPIEMLEGDLAVFTSASTVKGFCDIMGDVAGVTAICIGEQTKNEAEKQGMKTYVSDSATIASLVQKVVSVAHDNEVR